MFYTFNQNKTIIWFVLLAIFQYDFVDEVQTFSVEHDIEALGQICDRTTERVDHIIQQTRRLTVADTDRRRMRRRRRRQGDDVVEGDEDN